MKSNCLWYALDTQAQEGGAVLLVDSTRWCIPHAQHRGRSGVLTQFVPVQTLRYPLMSLAGFEGTIEVGDKDADKRGPMHPVCMGIGTAILFVSGALWLVTRTVQKLWRKA